MDWFKESAFLSDCYLLLVKSLFTLQDNFPHSKTLEKSPDHIRVSLYRDPGKLTNRSQANHVQLDCESYQET